MRTANVELRQMRLRTPSPQTPGEPLSRAELAELVNTWIYERTGRVGAVTASYVGKLERGLIRWPQQDYRDALRAILHAATDRDLGFRRPVQAGPANWERLHGEKSPREERPKRCDHLNPRPRAAHLLGSPSGPVAGCPATAQQRRPGLDGAPGPEPGPPTAILLPQSWCEAADRANAACRGDRADTRLVDALVATAQELAGMYRGADPRATLPMAIALADQMLDLLGAAARDADSVRLAAATVGVHAQVGMWACHNDRPQLAFRYLATACHVADGMGDAGTRARALGAFSFLFSSALRGGLGGEPARTLRLLEQALDTVDPNDQFTRGWLATWRADEHAILGNLPAARHDMDAAYAALGGTDQGPDGFFSRATYGYGVGAHLDCVRGITEALAGDADAAERTFAHACQAAANRRRAIATHAESAFVHARLGNPEKACDALRRSVAMAVGDPYPMGLRKAVGVRRSFDPSWSALPCVRDLDEQLDHVVRCGCGTRGAGAQ